MNLVSRERVRNPCAIVVPNGDCFARSGSTWIHCGSSIAFANKSIRSCVTSTHGEMPTSCPILLSSSRTLNAAAIVSPVWVRRDSICAARRYALFQASLRPFPDRTSDRAADRGIAHPPFLLAIDDDAGLDQHGGHRRGAADGKIVVVVDAVHL